MNVIDIRVSNITKVEENLPYKSVRITADFSDDGGFYEQETRLLTRHDYENILKTGEYQG